MGWTTGGVETFLRRVVATLLGLAMLSYEAFLHPGPPRWLILWAGLGLTFGPSVLGLLGASREPPPPPTPAEPPPTPAGDTGGRS